MGYMPASLKAFRETFPEVEVTLLELPLALYSDNTFTVPPRLN